MSYLNARDIFPDEILKTIQSYMDGEYIYIPKKDENKKAWGELTQIKEEFLIRNIGIYEEYLTGISIEILAKKIICHQNLYKELFY